MAQNSAVAEMETEIDYRVKLKSKKIAIEQLGKYRELLKKLLDGQSTIAEEVKQQILQDLLWDFDRGVQENILINGESWEDAPNDGDNGTVGLQGKDCSVRRQVLEVSLTEADCKTLDDLLDENILETTLKRSSYPKKILPYVVRSLKAERELMSSYKQAVKPQEMNKDPVQETIMSSLSEAAPKITRQASVVMKSLQGLQQKAAGVCQVLGMRPSGEAQEVHREVFGPPGVEEAPLLPGSEARSGQPLKRAVREMELSGAYALPAKKAAAAASLQEP
ncbi:kinetochore-associated protein NSL1 homolog isoform X1 [Conger conger]|uniref:kinetochore-associated protein NSL1 homolog isoform X1 n=1 Tax=Conger conger TaxID=82655 RepID=UPI002A5ADFEC|nr:kinetochore-associated protein NSL1 homolog isoform X1 [Conger conger]